MVREAAMELARRRISMKKMVLAMAMAVAMMATGLVAGRWERPVQAGGTESIYKVLKPIESGNLLLFPVVRTDGKAVGAQFLTLDEGLKSGEVEVTEAGNVRGLVRSRGGATTNRYTGDRVNTLVLVNDSKRPLLLLAGEIVTGGKQDRVIAKDRIVPVGADPIDLSVFCIEHGRWTESSSKFGTAGKSPAMGFMVQPTVRQEAMVAKSQQQVWDSVGGAVTAMAAAAAPAKPAALPPSANQTVTVDGYSGALQMDERGRSLGTTSYAKAMQNSAVSAKVDEESAGTMQNRDQVLATLRQEHAVGVVVALRGEIIWADLFSDPELLARYWTKLVRSYAAEGLGGGVAHKTATEAEAQRFLDSPSHGREDSEGEVGVYRYREVKTAATDLFSLESLLPGTGFDVHVSKLKIKGAQMTPVSEGIR